MDEAFALHRVQNTGVLASKGVQEVDQIGFLLVGEADPEPLIIKVQDVLKSVAAEPLWKYGARDASPRRIGPFSLPISLHLPLIIARPASVTM